MLIQLLLNFYTLYFIELRLFLNIPRQRFLGQLSSFCFSDLHSLTISNLVQSSVGTALCMGFKNPIFLVFTLCFSNEVQLVNKLKDSNLFSYPNSSVNLKSDFNYSSRNLNAEECVVILGLSLMLVPTNYLLWLLIIC